METSENQKKTYTDPITGKFIEGNPGGGRPPETEEVKLIKKARRELIEEYKDALAEALPFLSPILVAKAMEGDVSAIRELHDRVMNKPPQDVTSGGEKIQQIPIYGGLAHVQRYYSDSEDIQPESKD